MMMQFKSEMYCIYVSYVYVVIVKVKMQFHSRSFYLIL